MIPVTHLHFTPSLHTLVCLNTGGVWTRQRPSDRDNTNFEFGDNIDVDTSFFTITICVQSFLCLPLPNTNKYSLRNDEPHKTICSDLTLNVSTSFFVFSRGFHRVTFNTQVTVPKF